MFATHQGLKDLFEVSCEECDYLVETVKRDLNVLGARMMGGGFGGCTINLIYKDAVNQVSEKLKSDYKAKFNKDLKMYTVTIGNGAEEVRSE
jgi:galactokinase